MAWRHTAQSAGWGHAAQAAGRHLVCKRGGITRIEPARRITRFTSLLDGSVTYSYDPTGQLVGADYDYQNDENYTYDAGGNRITAGGTQYTTRPNNELLSDGTFWYEYDAEGNRTLRYVWTDADGDGQVDPGERSQITEYAWDHRGRLVRVTERASDGGPATRVTEHTYDYLNRWVARRVDPDGDGPESARNSYFVYDGTPHSGQVLLGNFASVRSSSVSTIPASLAGSASGDAVHYTLEAAASQSDTSTGGTSTNSPLPSAGEGSGVWAFNTTALLDSVGQIVLRFDGDARGTPQLTHHYLWGPTLDQILADEVLPPCRSPKQPQPLV